MERSLTEHWTFKNGGFPPGEPISGKTYRADGWAYKDFPKMKPEFWDELLELIGHENYVMLAFSDYGTSKRGQLLISPQGWENIVQRASVKH